MLFSPCCAQFIMTEFKRLVGKMADAILSQQDNNKFLKKVHKIERKLKRKLEHIPIDNGSLSLEAIYQDDDNNIFDKFKCTLKWRCDRGFDYWVFYLFSLNTDIENETIFLSDKFIKHHLSDWKKSAHLRIK